MTAVQSAVSASNGTPSQIPLPLDSPTKSIYMDGSRSAGSASPVKRDPVRLYVQGLPYRALEADARQLVNEIFEEFNIVKTELGKPPPSAKMKGHSECYAWITVASLEDAQRALEKLNGVSTSNYTKLAIIISQFKSTHRQFDESDSGVSE